VLGLPVERGYVNLSFRDIARYAVFAGIFDDSDNRLIYNSRRNEGVGSSFKNRLKFIAVVIWGGRLWLGHG